MKLSIYTFVQNGLYLDFHVVPMLRHHLPLADEIVVNEGYSTDGTYAALQNIDPKIKVFQSKWEWPSRKFKSITRERCSGDWCMLLDCDEFVPEWQFDAIRRQLESTDKLAFPLKYLNFYGNYKVLNVNPGKFRWPQRKFTVHRNLPNIENWGDGSNVRIAGHEDYGDSSIYGDVLAEVHHFGFVRNPARLRQKWRNQYLHNTGGGRNWIPSFVYDLFPHKWDDPQFLNDLAPYDGPYIGAVTTDPSEFVRDDLRLYKLINQSRAK
jgi:hypothetical protein